MNKKIQNTKRLQAGDHVKCIDDDFQHGLKLNEIYTVKTSESKSRKGIRRKINLEEIRGAWNRSRFILV